MPANPNCPICKGTGCKTPVEYEGCPIPCQCILDEALMYIEDDGK